MVHTRWLAMSAEVILAALVVVGVLASGNLFPVLGVFLSLLSPLPFVLLRLRHGFPGLALALTLTTVALGGLTSVQQGLAFLLEFGLPAILLAEGLRRASRPEVVVTGVAALLTLGGVGVLALASDQWARPLAAVSQHVEALLADMEAFTLRMGLSGEGPPPLLGSVEKLRTFLLMAYPGLFFAGGLLTASGYVLFLRSLIRRWPAQLGGLTPPPFRWELPELLVWAFIGAGILYLTGLPWPQAVGLNVLIILLGLYFLQGLSIAAFLFQRFHLPRLLATMSVMLLLFQPFLTLLVAGVGLFDVWFAFRRLSLPRSPGRT
ncbi:MAG: DUF2232 domain-containing protein [candidate division NC10 bacterium]|nr:DUF2232 domain-containing protein [candidate division NC10 bacterium]MBI2114326.1 DUF2232 domain-containing protein [candidate division NC10 bacterium]MBI2163623.1 DUF2232 domain-containing protein [candidate division NC10 bacterium]